jgi:hypothetical protein
MAKYAQITDCVDPAVDVSALNLADADVYVDLALGGVGITPAVAATITLPNTTLTAIASTWALHLACIQGAMQGDALLSNKAALYKGVAESLIKKLNRTALGLSEPAGTGFGSLTLGRA